MSRLPGAIQSSSPAHRRLWRLVASGTLIVAAIGIGWTTNAATLRAGLLVAAAALAGAGIAVQAARGLYQRQVTIDLLVTVAAAGASLIGEYWEAAAVTFLFLLGAFLEARLLGQSRQALAKLLDLAPNVAVVVRDGQQVTVPSDAVAVGETVVVKPGTRVPVDGTVTHGHAAVDESTLTGEALPVEKGEGSAVYAGTVSRDGLLWLRATSAAGDTMLARVIARVEEAQEQIAPMQRTIERFARWYTPAVIGLSGVAVLLTHRLDLGLTLLVIGCPGALVMATPVAATAGIGRAAQQGILIKGGQHLETVGRITAVALDKTGTLTEGRPRLAAVVGVASAPDLPCRLAGAPGYPWDARAQRLLCWAAIAEGGSEHPLARPVIAAASALGPLPSSQAFRSFPGQGVYATYAGHAIAVGTPGFLAQLGVVVPSTVSEQLARLHGAGMTALLVALDQAIIGLLGIADRPRAAAATLMRRLGALGVRRVAMITGDGRQAADAIARQVGITEVQASALPEEKLAAIRRLQADGHVVAMVGDGINDAPALAAADVGIAMGAGGTAIAVDTADVVLMTDDLQLLPEAIRLARATLRIIRQNLVLALVTVGGLLIGVLLGDLHMAGGMLVHQASVMLVIVNGMRLLRA